MNAAPGTRDRILAAAAKVLTEKGYSTTRLAEVADIAGLRGPAVYYYFSSRDDLVAEVMVTGQRWLRQEMESALASLPRDAAPGERIDRAVETHLTVELARSDFASAVTRNSGQVPPEIRDAFADESDAYHALWRALIAHAKTAGVLHPGLEPGVARMLVIGALNWSAEWYRTSGTPIDIVIRTAQTLIRHSLISEQLQED